ncbi:MAG: hypothetical protein GXO02_00480 [Epsilonproteobacteria bacterium]|nr:hypothetical protein [Campylobacterota bacterium]
MKKIILLLFIFLLTILNGQNNETKDNNLTKKHIQEQIKREQKYAKEKTFYMGDEYNLTEKAVDEKSLENVPVISPEYDFDIDDLYDDK